MNTSSMSLSKYKSLVMQGMQAAIVARTKSGLDFKSPISIDCLCKSHGVKVRFCDINMEGMYDKESKHIFVSALRPLARRVFTCMHELGHHVFKHGSTIDELQTDLLSSKEKHPNEILADTFAAFTLMPTLGVREAFAIRGLNPEVASASELYAIACNFGVGQSTFVNHLAYTLDMLSPERRAFLGKVTPKKIRTELLGVETSEPLIYADSHWSAPTLDAEVGMFLLLPLDVIVDITKLKPEGELPYGRLFRTIKPGIVQVIIPGTPWATFIRIARKQYTGLAHFRHLEDEDLDDE